MPLPVEPMSNRLAPASADSPSLEKARFAMRLSLAVGVLMMFGKVTAFWVTHSAAIFSDAAESVVHLLAVVFAAFSLQPSARPAEAKFLFGYERISFFSAGFEGAMIILAAIALVVAAIHKMPNFACCWTISYRRVSYMIRDDPLNWRGCFNENASAERNSPPLSFRTIPSGLIVREQSVTCVGTWDAAPLRVAFRTSEVASLLPGLEPQVES